MSEESGGSELEVEERRPFDESDLLPISRLADIEFCERRAALHLIEMAWEDNVHTAEGSIMHERAHGDETPEKRGKLIILRSLRVRSLRLGIIGKADVVELHRAGDGDDMAISIHGHAGRWLVYPVEYKPGGLKQQRSFQIQLCAQALCLEEMLNAKIPSGAIYYGKTKRRLDIAFNEKLRRETEAAVARLHELLKSRATPQAVQGPKCKKCSLVDLCLPNAASGQRSVHKYLARAIAEAGEGQS